MHEHVDTWPPLPGAVFDYKTHRYVAIIEGFNHGLEWVPGHYKEITLFGQ